MNVDLRTIAPLGRHLISSFIEKLEGTVMKRSVISIVDDDLSFRQGITDLVRSMGLEAQPFERADDFLQSVHPARTDCLIADMRMPGMSGFELHDSLVRFGIMIPMIVVTAHPLDADRLRAEQSGIVCYLAKPCDEHQLLECIRSALAGERRRS
jgi:FixJ family two-component response regulator